MVVERALCPAGEVTLKSVFHGLMHIFFPQIKRSADCLIGVQIHGLRAGSGATSSAPGVPR